MQAGAAATLEAQEPGRRAAIPERKHRHSRRTDHELEEFELVGVAAQLRLVLQQGTAQSISSLFPSAGVQLDLTDEQCLAGVHMLPQHG